ncbi:glycosyltransferase family 2 protein [Polynucleobacter kasalickyi]|uniref:Glycosyltransferase involved in cell wall bisynthesis n=1 Tax=Polynucleobacter kasalickyi TaxID=1938817 RepID=A0A1W1Y1R1_9BURK|nr:glycosyltransferase family 2 protein [Polynucleobacter kasalickyi]SMC30082.1 Glycosyltransferase involved in cell wall bisynthesis [Polynucleobacter kasalickyi]
MQSEAFDVKAKLKKITIMTPAFNEEAGIQECYLAVKEFFCTDLPNYDYEHLFIDNCSKDKTVDILKKIAQEDKRVKIIVNSRNFGPNNSPYHAILESTGDAVIPVLADLQTPVSTIKKFVELWEDGYDMVLGLRVKMSEPKRLQFVRNLYYSLMSKLSPIEHYHGFIGFGLFDAKTVKVMRSLVNPNPYFRRIVSEIGFEKAFVEYEQPLRKNGKSRLKLYDLVDYAILGVTSCSTIPLRAMTILGVAISFISFLAAIIYLIFKILYWDSFVLGSAPLIIGMFFLASVQIFCLGLIGEYVGLIFNHARNRPLVIEKERVNF